MTEPRPRPLQGALTLVRQLAVESGQLYWTEERLQAASPRRKQVQLFLVSFLILFFELACIRWIPANVRYLGFFLNFILLATFLGIGVGILSSRRPGLWLPPFPLLAFVLVAVVARNTFVLDIPSTEVLYYGISENTGRGESFWILPLMFTLMAITIVPLSRMLGRLLTSLPPLQAYGVDILGSLAGIAAFFLASYFSLQPVVWFAIAAGLNFLLRPGREMVFSLPLLAGAVYIVHLLSVGSMWSPYYQIRTVTHENAIIVTVNGIGHQTISPIEEKENFYFKVYELLGETRQFERALIIGAGTGSDAAIALAEGVQQVTIVEIDPLLYQLGQELNPAQPYQDARVQAVIDDGRFYLNNSAQTYDLILFGLPDSLTLTSGFSSLRLESFLLTAESIEAARERLTEDGVLVLYNYYREDWLVRKMAGLLENAFGEPPYVTTYGASGRAAVLVAGPGLAGARPFIDQPFTEGFNSSDNLRGYQLPVLGEGRLGGDPTLDLTVDDWPFVYMPTRALPGVFLGALGVALAISIGMTWLAAPGGQARRPDWHFFLLGVAFLLLETRSLVTFALLFGTTWMVNSLVFFAILSSVYLAILFNARVKIRRPRQLYALLLLTLIANFLIPTNALLAIENTALRYTLVSALAFVPIFLANVIFTHSFRDSLQADQAFGWNLLGAMAGGLLEYFALLIGYQGLVLIALLAYGLAFVAYQRRPAELQAAGGAPE